MIWAILAAVGVLCGCARPGILTLLVRSRSLRKRPGNVPVRLHHPGKGRWTPGHGVWIRDVFAFRGLPAAWKEELIWGTDASVRAASEKERKKLHRIGDESVIATLTLGEGGTIELAAHAENNDALLGPFAAADHRRPVSATT